MSLSVTCRNGGAMVTALSGNPLLLLGASVRVSAKPGEVVGQLSVYPAIGNQKEGVIVLVERTQKEQRPDDLMPVRATWDSQGKLTIDDGSFSKRYFNLERVGQVYADPVINSAWIEVEIGDIRYTSNPNRARKPGFTYVADADLLIKWWGGVVDDEAVKQAAIETEKELDLGHQLGMTEARLTETEAELRTTKEDLCTGNAAFEALQQQNVLLLNGIEAWKRLAGEAINVLRGRWFKGRQAKNVLKDARILDPCI